MDYWTECISKAFNDAGIVATQDQISTVVCWIERSYELFGVVHGYDCIPNPESKEIEDLKKRFYAERDKSRCENCKGTGYYMGDQCWKCKGDGRV